ncbi:hypothetical protein ILUMI_12744 [Ignelater luminosus]|uniref:Uncharacterized protein n=1 Tax=Ignelater luminosus TaxID=2038154 RepID=A0A8K0GC18_IGNLU|nr:hypothetical protein ILUMI_12744 [Ignelater luminosus]
MRIGTIDVRETEKLRKRKKRRSKQLSRRVTLNGSIVCDSVTNTEIERTDTPVATPEPASPFTLEPSSAAATTSAVLQDVRIITKEEKKLVIDKNKVRKPRQKCRLKLKKQYVTSSLDLKGLFFGCRNDKALNNQKIGKSESEYLGHVTSLSGSGKSIAKFIIIFLYKTGINPKGLLAIGCDGTGVLYDF